jgi:hypothetical protein
LLARAGTSVRVCESSREAVAGAAAVYGPSAPGAERAADLLPVEQAVLRTLVTGDWEV